MLRKVGLVGRWVGREGGSNGVKHVYSQRVSSIGGVANPLRPQLINWLGRLSTNAYQRSQLNQVTLVYSQSERATPFRRDKQVPPFPDDTLINNRKDATKGQLDIAIDNPIDVEISSTHPSLNNSSIDARKIVLYKASGNQCAIHPF
ncbi:hypothetical protein G5I_00718 [Acromyrmex echinatior]|uniref:Uncharacterized protein n=1 Tax=Acromyrmex echinatior TaxID=103372 RepID=F4W5M0_ACREC|nr:hypothetical protein G5I_00718 [Acromyrmex echinatior]